LVNKLTKTEKIIIRCKPELKRDFKRFVAEYDFKNMADALEFLLRKGRELLREGVGAIP